MPVVIQTITLKVIDSTPVSPPPTSPVLPGLTTVAPPDAGLFSNNLFTNNLFSSNSLSTLTDPLPVNLGLITIAIITLSLLTIGLILAYPILAPQLSLLLAKLKANTKSKFKSHISPHLKQLSLAITKRASTISIIHTLPTLPLISSIINHLKVSPTLNRLSQLLSTAKLGKLGSVSQSKQSSGLGQSGRLGKLVQLVKLNHLPNFNFKLLTPRLALVTALAAVPVVAMVFLLAPKNFNLADAVGPCSGQLCLELGSSNLDLTVDKFQGNKVESNLDLTIQNNVANPYYLTVWLVDDGSSQSSNNNNFNISIASTTLTNTAQNIYADSGTTISSTSPHLPLEVSITDNLPVGTYTLQIAYEATYDDTTPPVITINGNNPTYHEAKTTFTDLGASAIDNIDGVIVPTIAANTVNPNSLGNYIVSYSATDAAGNTALATRNVIVHDTTPPIITVEPTLATVSINQGDSIDLMAGVTATDSYDGNLTSSVSYVSAPTFNNSTIGSYTITYSVSDSSGNAATAKTKTVNVLDSTAPTGLASYSTTAPTNQDVTVTIDTDEPIVTPTDWTLVSETQFTKVYGANAQEQLEICDASNNCSNVNITISNIDKTPPNLSITYSPAGPTKTNTDVAATITSDEALATPLPTGWTAAGNNTYQKTYTANTDGNESVSFADLVGNPANINVNISWIDKAPTISSLNPSSGYTTGGVNTTITGTNFINTANVQSVTIGGNSCPIVSVTATTIVCTVPVSSTAGAKDVVVTTQYGNVTKAGGYTYQSPITAIVPSIASTIAPTSDVTTSGPQFSLVGTNLNTVTASDIKIGGNPCKELSVNSAGTTATCTGPTTSLSAGVKTVTVKGGGTTATVTYNSTSYPTLQSVSPGTGPNQANCQGTPTNPVIYRDTRDSQLYYVAKMQDDKCWMLDNLRYRPNGDSSGSNQANFTATQVWSGQLTTTGDIIYTASELDAGKYIDPMAPITILSKSYCSNSAGNYSPQNITKCGLLYNWYTATAGTSNYSVTADGTQASGSICPANWRLPSGSSGSGGPTTNGTDYTAADLPVLNASMQSGSRITGDTSNNYSHWQPGGSFRGVFSGYWYMHNNENEQGNSGRFWSSTVRSIFTAYDLLYYDGNVSPGNGNYPRYIGLAVRCVSGL